MFYFYQNMKEIQIKELDLSKIMPNSENMNRTEQGGSKIVVIGKPGTGKCLGQDVPVLMADKSWSFVQNIKVGDKLMGDDMKPRNVLSVCSGRDILYKVVQNNGMDYICNSEHILVLKEIGGSHIVEGVCDELYQTQHEWKNIFRGYNLKGGESSIRIMKLDLGDYYGFEIDGNGRFCLKDGTVTHNTTLITRILYEKRNIFPSAFVMSGTEDSNGHYSKILPSTFVHNRYDEDKVNNFITRQKIAKKHLPNPWSVLLLDDCTDDPRIFNKPIFQGLFKNGRHWKMLFVLSLQYCMDVKPVIRTNIDGVFILRETNLQNRKRLYDNYAGIIPTFAEFCSIMDQITNDYTALYIHNATTSNRLDDCLFYYKAKPVPDKFKFGSKDFWKFHSARYNDKYTDPFAP